MYLVTLLDGFYIKKLSEGKDSVAVLEQDFFSCLNALPKLSLEHLQIKEDSFEKQTFSQVESKINNVQQKIYDHCKKTTGHKIIREREEGPYGETFYYCQLCGFEKS